MKDPSQLYARRSLAMVSVIQCFKIRYFDPVRYTIVDPMHNLFLGSAKHTFKVWIKKGLLTLRDLERFEEDTRTFSVPNSAGRLPLKLILLPIMVASQPTNGATGSYFFHQYCSKVYSLMSMCVVGYCMYELVQSLNVDLSQNEMYVQQICI